MREELWAKIKFWTFFWFKESWFFEPNFFISFITKENNKVGKKKAFLRREISTWRHQITLEATFNYSTKVSIIIIKTLRMS